MFLSHGKTLMYNGRDLAVLCYKMVMITMNPWFQRLTKKFKLLFLHEW